MVPYLSCYYPEVVFQDTIQRIEDKAHFMALCARLIERPKELRMDVQSVAKRDNVIFLEWTRTMMFGTWPSTPVTRRFMRRRFS